MAIVAAALIPIAQVSIVGPKELQIRARRGALQFAYAGETEKIAEGASYRIVLDAPEAAPPFPQRVPTKAGRESKKYKIIAIVAIGWATEWGFHEIFESPARP